MCYLCLINGIACSLNPFKLKKNLCYILLFMIILQHPI